MVVYDDNRTEEIVDGLVRTGNCVRRFLIGLFIFTGAIVVGLAGEVAGTGGALAGLAVGAGIGGVIGAALGDVVVVVVEWMAQSLVAKAEIIRRLGGAVLCVALAALQATAAEAAGENAATYYRQAFERMPPFPDSVKRQVIGLVKGSWTDPPADMVTYISEDRGILELVAKGVATTTCDFLDGQKATMSRKLPHLGKARELGRYLVLKGRHFEHKGAYAEALDCYGLVMSLGGHLAQNGTTTGFLVASGVQKMADGAFSGAATYPREHARKALQMHGTLSANRPSLAAAVAGEGAVLCATDESAFAGKIPTEEQMRTSCRESSADLGDGVDPDVAVDAYVAAMEQHGFFDPAVHLKHLHDLAGKTFGAYAKAAEDMTLRSWNEQHERIVDLHGLDPQKMMREQMEMISGIQRGAAVTAAKIDEDKTKTEKQKHDARVAAIRKMASDIARESTPRVARLMVGMTVPMIKRVGETQCGNLLEARATATHLALALHKAEHGSYPDAFAALIPSLLPAVPVDPFDGEPLRYRREGDSYVFYSVGKDLTDDGGVPLPRPPVPSPDKGAEGEGSFGGFALAATPPKPTGQDIVFTPPGEGM